MASVQHRTAVSVQEQQSQQVKVLEQKKMKWTKMSLTPEQQAAAPAKHTAKQVTRESKVGTVARRLRIIPTQKQALQLQHAFNACRWIYNNCVDHINANGKKRKDLAKTPRSKYVNVEPWKQICTSIDPNWSDIPYEVRDAAMRDATKATVSSDALMDNKAAALNKKSNKVCHFKSRRKKDIMESIMLRHRDLNRKNTWFGALFGSPADRAVMKTKKALLPTHFSSDTRLLHDKRLHRYYFIISIPPPPQSQPPPSNGSDSQAPMPMEMVKRDVVSIDPGVRTFLTCFDPQRLETTKIGERANNTLWNLANQLHGVVVHEARLPAQGGLRNRHRTARHLRRVARRQEQHIRHCVDELHHKAAHWLTSTFNHILLPKFDTKQMAEKRDATTMKWKRRITKKTVSQLYSLAHYRFRAFLLHKAHQHGATVFLVNEANTTKTCSQCGATRVVGGAETYHCLSCGLVIDRDTNAAVNILLKFIHDNQGPASQELPLAAVATANLKEALARACY